ncbi:hypothetical protein C5167_008646 [Papaver somniferum]|uniref:Uncharacterized protein n=1 Tax=Papaver somniferum TaxID=3469 RepID=A0A4Y7JYV4_PAPSO|nr:hypothetical protein C5167_008646 [Papaver somniferum]
MKSSTRPDETFWNTGQLCGSRTPIHVYLSGRAVWYEMLPDVLILNDIKGPNFVPLKYTSFIISLVAVAKAVDDYPALFTAFLLCNTGMVYIYERCHTSKGSKVQVESY